MLQSSEITCTNKSKRGLLAMGRISSKIGRRIRPNFFSDQGPIESTHCFVNYSGVIVKCLTTMFLAYII